MTNATPGSQIDDSVGALERALCDILGIPIDTDINNALLTVVAGGIKTLQFADSTLDPVSAGAMQRNGSKLLWHNGERPVELQPAGEVKWLAGSTAPSGWLAMDGAAVSRTAYARLFAILGTAFGVGDGSTTFNLPNVKGRTVVCRDPADPTFDTLGETGGEKNHMLTQDEMPSHTHVATVNDPGHQHLFISLQAPGGIARFGPDMQNTPGLTDPALTGITVTNGATGSNGAHNNLPPFITFNAFIST